MFATTYATSGYKVSQEKLSGPAAVAAFEGWGPTAVTLVARRRGLRRPVFGVMSNIGMSSQDDLGQGPACSALAIDP